VYGDNDIVDAAAAVDDDDDDDDDAIPTHSNSYNMPSQCYSTYYTSTSIVE